jgi:hypothetical protein
MSSSRLVVQKGSLISLADKAFSGLMEHQAVLSDVTNRTLEHFGGSTKHKKRSGAGFIA